MAFYNKVKWILGILVVFLLIVTTNLIDRNNFLRVKDSIETIYEDRLIANDLIFEMSKSIQDKEVAVAISDAVFFSDKNTLINKNLQNFVLRYEKTKLTQEEESVFSDYKQNLALLTNSEIVFIQSKFTQKTLLVTHISNLKENLYSLSKIQLNEGSRQMSVSKKAIDTVELFTHIEIYILILLAIIIQIIVIYTPKKDSNN